MVSETDAAAGADADATDAESKAGRDAETEEGDASEGYSPGNAFWNDAMMVLSDILCDYATMRLRVYMG